MSLIAVTGASGFIGRHLTVRLAAAGAEVRAILRPDSKKPAPPNATVIRSALTTEALTGAFSGADVVVHLAGCVRARRAEDFTRGNVDSTRAAAQAARAVNARFIYVSSLAAAGPSSPAAPRTELDPAAPLTPYGASKLAGERAVTEATGLHWTILRPGVVYGPQDAALLALFRMADRGILPAVGRAGAAYTFIYIDDVVRAIERAVERPLDGRTIFLGHPEPVTTLALLQQIRSASAGSALILPIPLPVTRAAAALCDLTTKLTGRLLPLDSWRYAELAAEGFVCRVDVMRELLGVEPQVSLTEGLAKTAAWYRANGFLRPL
jgi:nucleoside-diphosphate-sugar epimerase